MLPDRGKAGLSPLAPAHGNVRCGRLQHSPDSSFSPFAGTRSAVEPSRVCCPLLIRNPPWPGPPTETAVPSYRPQSQHHSAARLPQVLCNSTLGHPSPVVPPPFLLPAKSRIAVKHGVHAQSCRWTDGSLFDSTKCQRATLPEDHRRGLVGIGRTGRLKFLGMQNTSRSIKSQLDGDTGRSVSTLSRGSFPFL